MLATNLGGVDVGCHCWVAIAGCHCWGAMLGCHCWGAIAGCHTGVLLGAIAGVPLNCGMPWLDAIAGC